LQETFLMHITVNKTQMQVTNVLSLSCRQPKSECIKTQVRLLPVKIWLPISVL